MNDSRPTALDVAAAIIEEAGPIDHMKLQKLLFYAQAWFLAWYDEPLFEDPVEAWTWGPVIEDVYQAYKAYEDRPISAPMVGSSAALDDRAISGLRAVLKSYRDLTGPELARRTHAESPWPEARHGLAPDDRSRRVIPPERLKAFYRSEGEFGEGGNGDELAAALGLSRVE